MESGTCTLLGPEGPGRLPSGGGVDSPDPFLTPGCVGEGYRPYFENYTVDASILDSSFGSSQMIYIDHWSAAFGLPINQNTHVCGQISKSKRWMPWHLEPMKDVVICDKPRGADKRASIRGSPNGETPLGGVPTQ